MHYIGVDIGGSNISAAVLDDSLRMFVKKSVKTNGTRPYDEVREDIIILIESVIAAEKLDRMQISSIGIGCPGICNAENGVVEFSNNLNWHDAPLKDDVERHFNIKTFLDNDANAAAYGEFIAGAAKGANSAVVITLGTGVGSGIIINKKLLYGENYAGAEIGHTVIEVDGEPCTCGRKGCFEAYSSSRGLIHMTKEALKEKNSSMNELVEKDGKISARTAFYAARLDDEAGVAVVKKYIKYLAAGIANTINIFQPDILCVGGGICNEGDYLLVPLKELVDKEIFSRGSVKRPEIKICELGNDAGIIGAAMLFKERMGDA